MRLHAMKAMVLKEAGRGALRAICRKRLEGRVRGLGRSNREGGGGRYEMEDGALGCG